MKILKDGRSDKEREVYARYYIINVLDDMILDKNRKAAALRVALKRERRGFNRKDIINQYYKKLEVTMNHLKALDLILRENKQLKRELIRKDI